MWCDREGGDSGEGEGRRGKGGREGEEVVFVLGQSFSCMGVLFPNAGGCFHMWAHCFHTWAVVHCSCMVVLGPRSPFVVLGPRCHSCNLAGVLVHHSCCWALVAIGGWWYWVLITICATWHGSLFAVHGAGSSLPFVQPGMGPRSPFMVLGPRRHSCNLAWVLVRRLWCWVLVTVHATWHGSSFTVRATGPSLPLGVVVAGRSLRYLWVVVVPLIGFCVPWCVGPPRHGPCRHWRVRVVGHCSWVPMGSRWWMAVAFVGLVGDNEATVVR